MREKLKNNWKFLIIVAVIVVLDVFMIYRIVQYNQLSHEETVEVHDDFYRFNYEPGEHIDISDDDQINLDEN